MEDEIEIYKLQRPIMQSEPPIEGHTNILIYNESRSFMDEILMDNPTVMDIFPSNILKVYWLGCFVVDPDYEKEEMKRQLQLIAPADPQEW